MLAGLIAAAIAALINHAHDQEGVEGAKAAAQAIRDTLDGHPHLQD